MTINVWLTEQFYKENMDFIKKTLIQNSYAESYIDRSICDRIKHVIV